MRQLKLTILERDVDRVIACLGRRGVIHLSGPADQGQALGRGRENAEAVQRVLEAAAAGAAYLGIPLPAEPDESAALPGGEEAEQFQRISAAITRLQEREQAGVQEKKRLEEALHETRAFGNLKVPFSTLDQLSYVTLRIGRLEVQRQEQLRQALGDRALIIPLEQDAGGERILAAASRKGRFALDSELKKQSFVPITLPHDFKGIPAEMLGGLESRLAAVEQDLERIGREKAALRDAYTPVLRRLTGSYLMAFQVEQLKGRLQATASVYILQGWAPSDLVRGLAAELAELTQGRIGVRAFHPHEIRTVREGREKVPVSLCHGGFVRGFEKLVFSYGAPLYGAIDPTPFVAFFFTILFGVMFGDLGQGLVLLLLGLLAGGRGPKVLAKFRHYASPLKAVGLASMVMGLVTGEFFTNSEVLAGPTKAALGFFMRVFRIPGEAPGHILHLMPEKGHITKLFYFFGFTLALGAVLNSIGLIVNIINRLGMKRYEEALFAKTGLAGLAFFWYAAGIAVRLILGGRFFWFDLLGLAVPLLGIFFGHALWRLLMRERPVFQEGAMVFIMEGFVEILETLSTYISNTVSFLRVGAFALSHAVLSLIVFTLSEMVQAIPAGPVFSLFILIFGNAVIIILEGMIVAIQVVRLQYYEFFSKFFTETGVEFTPFRFRKGVNV
ncbi:MAG: V-type ATP synthase subunit I [Treponema sp.]|jgi:V/A-type H+-transporting ATPase subunit I|nr:V-type ATP synthase subunit I [Treponema sp.]